VSFLIVPFFSLLKVSLNLNAITKLKEFLSSESIHSSLEGVIKFIEDKTRHHTTRNETIATELLNIGKIAHQVLDIENSLS
jgi:hypothetical protein